MEIIWDHKTHKRMPGIIRLTAPKTVRISYMYERKIYETLEIIKLRTINEKDRTLTVLNRKNCDCITTISWKPLFMKIGNHQTAPSDINIMTLTFATFQFENGFL